MVNRIPDKSKAKIINLQIWKEQVPRLVCRGREGFFQTAPFTLERAIRATKLNPGHPFFRGVFNPHTNQLKFYEIHSDTGDILSATLYARHLNRSEMGSLTEQLKKAGLSYKIVSGDSNQYQEELFLPGQGKAAELTEGLGESREQTPNFEVTRQKVASSRGEMLLEEVYDQRKVLLDITDVRLPFKRQKYFSPAQGVKLAFRLGFDTEEDLQHIVQNYSGRIELALPYQSGLYNRAVKGRIPQIAELIKGSRLEVANLHAVQDSISHENFLTWGEEVLELADALGASTVTFHPNNIKSDKERRISHEQALGMIKALQARHQAEIAIETFPGYLRLFRPSDLMDYKLPIVLDASHISFSDSLHLMQKYSWLIRTLHLSAQGEASHHLPVDRFCLDLLEAAMQAGWKGDVVLEYLPQYQGLVAGDLKRLQNFLYNPNG